MEAGRVLFALIPWDAHITKGDEGSQCARMHCIYSLSVVLASERYALADPTSKRSSCYMHRSQAA